MIVPNSGYVLIKDKQVNKIGNFDLVSEDQKESMIGEVISVGDMIVEDKYKHLSREEQEYLVPCKKGDTIVYPKYHSSSFTWEGEEYKIVKFEDILCIIEEDK